MFAITDFIIQSCERISGLYKGEVHEGSYLKEDLGFGIEEEMRLKDWIEEEYEIDLPTGYFLTVQDWIDITVQAIKEKV